MPSAIETTVYTFDELNDKAKEKARDWWREGAFDYEWWSYDDFIACAACLGIEIGTHPETYSIAGKPGTKSRERISIGFSGFWSQGDGAHFEGVYTPKRDALAAIKEHSPNDTTLHGIATALESALAKGRGTLESITIKQDKGSHYSHEYTMEFDFHYSDDDCSIEEGKEDNAVEPEFIEAFRAFARWIYRQLEEQYESMNSDENVDENIKANEYTFTADGRRFG